MHIPPTPVAARRWIGAKRRHPFIEKIILTASSRKRIPFRTPLLRMVVANPRTKPEATIETSCNGASCPLIRKLRAKRRYPKNVNNAKVLSPYGEERKRPAGDTTCRQAAMNESF
jgi:hypothetical protein